MPGFGAKSLIPLLAAAVISGCASSARELMPTPLIYQSPGGEALFSEQQQAPRHPDVDLLFITDRALPSATELEVAKAAGEAAPPYGQARARRIAFGSVQVRMVPALDWQTLLEQSRLAERTRPVELELGRVQELAAFPQEPYQINRTADGDLIRDRVGLQQHLAAKEQLQQAIAERLQQTSKGEVLLYVHGFNETFASAAFTTAELCHFLGREQVCTFFTWPSGSEGNFLTAYTRSTETAEFAVEHLKKTLRIIASTPGVERLQILAHSRGTAVTLSAMRELALEAIAAGYEPAQLYPIENLVLLSPDIDVDIATQQITGFLSDPDLVTVWPEARLPRALHGRLTVYASPNDRALFVSRILFRSRNRVGQLTPDDLTDKAQAYLALRGRTDLITYDGKRTDLFGHAYFTTNPQVSGDLIELIRFGKLPGDPGRDLIQTGPVTWRFPTEIEQQARKTAARPSFAAAQAQAQPNATLTP